MESIYIELQQKYLNIKSCLKKNIPRNRKFLCNICVLTQKTAMKFCNTSQNWTERKRMFQSKKLQFLISIRESYERRLASISASISKLEEQMNLNEINSEI